MPNISGFSSFDVKQCEDEISILDAFARIVSSMICAAFSQSNGVSIKNPETFVNIKCSGNDKLHVI